LDTVTPKKVIPNDQAALEGSPCHGDAQRHLSHTAGEAGAVGSSTSPRKTGTKTKTTHDSLVEFTFHNFWRQIFFGQIPQLAWECKYQQATNLVCSDFWVPSLAIKHVNAKHPILQGRPNISWLLTP